MASGTSESKFKGMDFESEWKYLSDGGAEILQIRRKGDGFEKRTLGYTADFKVSRIPHSTTYILTRKSKSQKQSERQAPTRVEDALLNSVVFQNILNWMDPNVEAMKNLRLVCKDWYQETLARWRSTAVLRLVSEDHRYWWGDATPGVPLREFQNECLNPLSLVPFPDPQPPEPCTSKDAADYLAYHFAYAEAAREVDFMQLDKYPYANYCLKRWNWNTRGPGNPSADEIHAREQFWKDLGPHIEFLHLDRCEFRHVKSFQEFGCIIFEKTPNLKTLKITNCEYPPPGGPSRDVTFPEGTPTRGHYVDRPTAQQAQRLMEKARKSCNQSVCYPPRRQKNLRVLDISGQLPYFWQEFLQHTPKVQVIRSRHDPSGEEFNCLAKALYNVKTKARLNLRELDVMLTSAFRLDNQEITTLKNCGFPLRSLKIELDKSQDPRRVPENNNARMPLNMMNLELRPRGPGQEPEVVAVEDDDDENDMDDNGLNEGLEATIKCHTLLEPYARTLEKLEIFRNAARIPHQRQTRRPFRNFSIGTTRLEALRELHLWGYVTDSFDFLLNTPNLRSLKIAFQCIENYLLETPDDSDEANPVAIDLQPPGFEYFSTKLWLPPPPAEPVSKQNFSKLMTSRSTNLHGFGTPIERFSLPSLTSLHIDLCFPSKNLKQLGEWLPNLKTLKTILRNETITTAMQMWPKLDVLVLLPSPDATPTISDDKIVEIAEDFENLQRFEMDTICGESRITFVSAYAGFAKITTLQTLKISVAPEFSQDAEEFLRRRIPNVQVLRKYCTKCKRKRKSLAQIAKPPSRLTTMSSAKQLEAELINSCECKLCNHEFCARVLRATKKRRAELEAEQNPEPVG